MRDRNVLVRVPEIGMAFRNVQVSVFVVTHDTMRHAVLGMLMCSCWAVIFGNFLNDGMIAFESVMVIGAVTDCRL